MHRFVSNAVASMRSGELREGYVVGRCVMCEPLLDTESPEAAVADEKMNIKFCVTCNANSENFARAYITCASRDRTHDTYRFEPGIEGGHAMFFKFLAGSWMKFLECKVPWTYPRPRVAQGRPTGAIATPPFVKVCVGIC